MKKEHVVLVLCLIFISFLIYRINDNEIFIQIKQIQVNGKYTIQFKEEGNYKVLNSNNQCVILMHVGKKEKNVTLPYLAHGTYYIQDAVRKQKIVISE